MTPPRVIGRLRALWNWNTKDAELDQELAFHLSEEVDEGIAAGLSPEQARAAAHKDFGSRAAIREATRETWGWSSAERLLQDARHAFRMMRRQPGFSALAVLTLALGIGATTAIVSVVNALMIRPLPFPEADRLVVLFATSPQRGIFQDTTSFLDFTAWKTESRSFAAAAAYRLDPFNITGDGLPEPIAGVRASHELFAVLGMRPLLGRGFNEQEQRANAGVAVISHGLWTRRYAADPLILGKSILLNEINHTVIGVLPDGFQFPPFQDTDVIVPVLERTCRSCGYIRAVARLRPDVAVSAAQDDLTAIARGLEQAFPASNEGRGVNVMSLHDVAVGRVGTPLVVLLGAGIFVLLIGCGNVGNLVLARGLARRRELAVRSALGAGIGRLIRQLITESVALALVAGLLGAFLAIWGGELLESSLSQRFPLPAITFDWMLFGFALAIALASGFLTAFPPAFMVWKANWNTSLREDNRSQTGGAAERRLGALLVVCETALTVVLLVAAGLLMKSFIRLQQVDLGLNPRHVLSADLVLSKRYADPSRRELFLGELLAAIARTPGVQEVAVHTDPPFMGGGSRETFKIDGHEDPGPRNGHPVSFNVVGGNFFRAMGISIVRGRAFVPSDTGARDPVAVINESMARKFWANADPIGQRLHFYYDKDPQRWLSIVGVARDVRYHGRFNEAVPQVFVPYQQNPYRSLPYAQPPYVSLVARTAIGPAAVAQAVQASIWSVDKDQPILNLQPMEQTLWQSVAEPRIYTLLLSVFAAIALLIASAGIYGLSACAVVRRTREIGIRMALGATSPQILALVLRRGMLLTLAGAGIGVAGALALTRVLAGFLYGISATDAATFAMTLALFATVACVATYIPASRAARIDPSVAFRYE